MVAVNRTQIKAEARRLIKTSQVPALAFTALYLVLTLVLDVISSITTGDAPVIWEAGLLPVFVFLLILLVETVLHAGYALYCLGIRRGERLSYLSLFDGFSLAGKVIALSILEYFFVMLWSMLFLIPGIIALYRYRFALYNLCEDPSLSPQEALNQSKAQTNGYKLPLFVLDLSFFGWMMLTSLPYAVANALLLQGIEIPLSTPVLTAVLGLFTGIFSIFVQPYLTFADLGYFDAAKQTSGVGVLPCGDNMLPPADTF